MVERIEPRRFRLAAVAFCVVGVTLAAAVRQARLPRVAAHDAGGDCARCHERQLPRTHDRSFVQESHGPAAQAARQACLGCHKPAQCDACHATAMPRWHSAAFRSPGLGPAERRAHGREAVGRRDACLECHSFRFRLQCATCHLRGEWPS